MHSCMTNWSLQLINRFFNTVTAHILHSVSPASGPIAGRLYLFIYFIYLSTNVQTLLVTFINNNFAFSKVRITPQLFTTSHCTMTVSHFRGAVWFEAGTKLPIYQPWRDGRLGWPERRSQSNLYPRKLCAYPVARIEARSNAVLIKNSALTKWWIPRGLGYRPYGLKWTRWHIRRRKLHLLKPRASE